MDVIYWVIFGLIAGISVDFLSPSNYRKGVINSKVLGIIGGILGGYLGLRFIVLGLDGFKLAFLLVAAGVALFVLFISGSFRSLKKIYYLAYKRNETSQLESKPGVKHLIASLNDRW